MASGMQADRKASLADDGPGLGVAHKHACDEIVGLRLHPWVAIHVLMHPHMHFVQCVLRGSRGIGHPLSFSGGHGTALVPGAHHHAGCLAMLSPLQLFHMETAPKTCTHCLKTCP